MRVLFLSVVILFSLTGAAAAAKPQVQDGKQITLTYKLSVNGTLLEVSDAKNPFTYIHGKHQIVPGLEKNLAGLRAGDQKTIRVPAAEAYGPVNPKALQEVAKDKLPPDVPQKAGTLLEARNPQGMAMLVKIVEVKEKTVVVDFNHPLAGKELEFQIEVLSIKA